jgi:K+-sensing histidine kinase KdpD
MPALAPALVPVHDTGVEPPPSRAWARLADCSIALGAVGVAVAAGRLAGLNPATIGFVFLLAVLAVAIARGLVAATVASFGARVPSL